MVVFVLIVGGTINLGNWGDGGLPTMSQELSNGPKTSYDVGDGNGISHSSTVYYTKETDPFVAEVDRVHFGGREKEEGHLEFASGWRRKKTEYREWNGSSWVTEATVNPGSWRATGHEELDWWNLENDVTLEGGALVEQRLEYRFFYTVWDQIHEYKWRGALLDHFLE